jgi:DNA-binding response OmpR family regulator
MARILIVEDDVTLQRIFTLMLVRRGHSVAEASSVASAEEAIHAGGAEFDILLLDINLPDGSGWDVLRHLRSGSPSARPRVIVMTAVRPVARRLEEFRPDAVLLKPFPINALLQLIDRELAQAQGTAPVEVTEEDYAESSPTGS